MRLEHVEFFERTRIEQHVDALAGRQAPLRVVFVDPILPAAQASLRLLLQELLKFFLRIHARFPSSKKTGFPRKPALRFASIRWADNAFALAESPRCNSAILYLNIPCFLSLCAFRPLRPGQSMPNGYRDTRPFEFHSVACGE